jgi:hypothetical protein
MPVICRNPGIETAFSPYKSQTATFSKVDGAAVREKLSADERLICTEDTPKRGFWTYWGAPYLEAEYGILCFWDIELKHNRTLIVTALSEIRMQTLLDVVRDAIGEPIAPRYATTRITDSLRPAKAPRKPR